MKLKNIFADKIVGALVVLNTLFFIYYVLLSFYSRPHYDDFHFLWKLKEMSIADYVSDMYYSRSGRFMGYFINGLIFKTIIFVGDHRFFPILFWFLGVGMSWLFTKALFRKYNSMLVFSAVLLFYNLFVLTAIDFPVFFWLCAMPYYLLTPMLLVTLLYVNKAKLTVIQWLLLVVLLIVLGGGQEAFTPIVLVVLFVNGLYYLHLYKYSFKNAIADVRIQKLLGAAVILIVCLLIVVVAPGNYKRMQGSDFVTPTSIMGYAKGIAHAVGMFAYYIAFYIPYYAILSMLFAKMGMDNVSSSVLDKYGYKRMLLVSSLLAMLYVLLSVLPSVYLFSGFGIQRNYTHVLYFILLYICFQAFLFGYFKLKGSTSKYLSMALNVGVWALVVIMVANIYSDTLSARSYAQSVDDRIEQLKKMNRSGVVADVEVEPLVVPFTTDTKYHLYHLLGKKNNIQPVLYYISDTKAEPNEYSYHFSKVYKLNFQIRLKK